MFYLSQSKIMSLKPLSKLMENTILTGPNYIEWLTMLRMVLSNESIDYVLEIGRPPIPRNDEGDEICLTR